MRAQAWTPVALTLLCAVLVMIPPGATQSGGGPEEIVSSGFVSAVDVLDDGTIIYGELQGDVTVISPDGTEETIYTAPTLTGPQWGLSAVRAAPDFNETGAVYVTYTWGPEGMDTNSDDTRGEMRLVRVENGQEERIFTYDVTRGHHGGRVYIHHDLLYVTNGDQYQEDLVQDPSTLIGKVLRMALDGEPAPGNPAETNPGWNPYAYTMGHRNPFGMSWDATRHQIVVASPGQSDNAEVDLLTKGGNYGWPECAGRCLPPNPDFVDPVWAWPETLVTPTSAVVVGGDIYVGGFSDKIIHRVHETESGWRDDPIITHMEGILSVDRSPDGRFLYVGSWSGLHKYPTPDVSVDKLGEEDWSVLPDQNDTGSDPELDPADDNGTPDGRAGPFAPAPGVVGVVALAGLAALAAARRR